MCTPISSARSAVSFQLLVAPKAISNGSRLTGLNANVDIAG